LHYILSGKEVPALIDSGAIIMVPEFVEEGSNIKVNTVTRQYVSKGDNGL
jgi:hypothetical protein